METPDKLGDEAVLNAAQTGISTTSQCRSSVALHYQKAKLFTCSTFGDTGHRGSSSKLPSLAIRGQCRGWKPNLTFNQSEIMETAGIRSSFRRNIGHSHAPGAEPGQERELIPVSGGKTPRLVRRGISPRNLRATRWFGSNDVPSRRELCTRSPDYHPLGSQLHSLIRKGE
jgi:hypothetical protein